MARRRSRLGLAAAGVLLALALVAGVVAAATATTTPTAADRYATATATKGSIEERLRLSGTVSRTKEVDATFDVTGTVTSVKVAIGDRVAAGQTLATVDKSGFDVALLQARASLARAEAQLSSDLDSIDAAAAAKAKAKAAAAKARKAAAAAAARTKAALARLQAAMAAVQEALAAQQRACAPVLSGGSSATAEELAACSEAMIALANAESAAAAAITATSATGGAAPSGATAAAGGTVSAASDSRLAADRADVLAAQQKVDAARANVAAATLKAPIAGVVGAMTLAKGGAASGRSVTIVGAGSAQVSIEVPLSVRPLVSAGQPAAIAAAGTTKELTGTVAGVSMLASTETSGTTATYTTRVDVADPDQLLRTGARADLSITLRTVTDVVTVPVSAVTQVTTTTGTVRLLAGADAAPQVVTVTTGAVGGGLIQIVGGLAEGQVVVLADRQAALPNLGTFGRRTSASASPSAVAPGAAPTSAPPATPAPTATR